MGKSYSKEELFALIEIESEYGPIRYINQFDLEREFFIRTGSRRASGPLYMACWRIRKGHYDHLLN